MFNICKPNTAWWDSVRTGNMKLFSQQIQNYVKRPDQRPTDIENNVIQGFTALHYACYLDRPEFVEKLLALEFPCCTTENVKINAKGISKSAKVQLPSRSNCLQIALLAGASQCIKSIIAYIEKNYPPQFEYDDFGRNTLAVAGMTQNDLTLFKNKWFCEQLSADEEHYQFMQNCCFFGRIQQLKDLSGFFLQESESKKLIYLMALQLDDEGKNCLQLCDKEVESDKFGTSPQAKAECRKYMEELCTEGIRYLAEKHAEEAISKFKASLGDEAHKLLGEEEFESEEED